MHRNQEGKDRQDDSTVAGQSGEHEQCEEARVADLPKASVRAPVLRAVLTR